MSNLVVHGYGYRRTGTISRPIIEVLQELQGSRDPAFNTQLEVGKRDGQSFRVVFKQVDLTGTNVLFLVKKSAADLDANAILTKKTFGLGGDDTQIAMLPPGTGREHWALKIIVAPTDTLTVEAGNYVFFLKMFPPYPQPGFIGLTGGFYVFETGVTQVVA